MEDFTIEPSWYKRKKSVPWHLELRPRLASWRRLEVGGQPDPVANGHLNYMGIAQPQVVSCLNLPCLFSFKFCSWRIKPRASTAQHGFYC